MSRRQLCLFVGIILISNPSQASDINLQLKLGGSVQQYEIESSIRSSKTLLESAEMEGESQSSSLQLGYRLAQSWHLELGYTDNGRIENHYDIRIPTSIFIEGDYVVLPSQYDLIHTVREKARLTSWNLGLKFQDALADQVDWFMRGGLTSWEYKDRSFVANRYHMGKDGIGWYVGAGLTYQLTTHWGIGLGADFSVVSDDFDSSNADVEAQYRHYLVDASAIIEYRF